MYWPLDVAVGAPESESAVVLYARPVVTLFATLTHDIDAIIQQESCFNLVLCIKYQGFGIITQTGICIINNLNVKYSFFFLLNS